MGRSITAKELSRILQQPGYSIASGEVALDSEPKKSKYGAIKCDYDGHRFDSKAEMRRYGDLRLLELTGHIKDLSLQPVFVLTGGVKYKGDFLYIEDGKTICEDVKGFETPAWRIKKKLFLELYPEIELRVTK